MQREKRFLNRQQRILLFGILFLFSVFIIFFGLLARANGAKEKIHLYKYYTSVPIHPGDTLWEIASEYCHDSVQITDYMDELKQINHLRGDDIHAGRYLTIVYYSEEYK